jgi:S-adenosylhomocysteine hydrolase
MKAASKAANAATDYVVKDISLAEWGRKEIAIAET